MTTFKGYKSPINIYVLWHPAFVEGKKYFSQLYSELCRNVQDPLSRGIGIPVFKRSETERNSLMPMLIPFDEADANSVIILIDDEMFNDLNWEKYINLLVESSGNKRLYPISISRYAHKFSQFLSEIQFINLHSLEGSNESETFTLRFERLYPRILHECSRQLLQMKPSYETEEVAPPPIKLFISHAKKDGETIAIEFRNYVRSETKLSSFFDANDIPDGYRFSKEIEDAFSKNAVVVVFQTDSYATREWCRREIILAKRFKTPIVVVNALKEFEKRSFPYMGNVPVIMWKKDFEGIVQRALYQILYQLYSELLLKKYIDLYLPGRNDVEFISTSPELFNYIDIIRVQRKRNLRKLYILYPDPPLGNEEIQLLNDIDNDVEFITPVLLPQKI
jgi:TIR domain